MHARHADDPNQTMDRQAALAVKRLKADEQDTHDDFLWFALAERLIRKHDYPREELEWMYACVEVGCPSCFQMLKWEQDIYGRVLGRCSKHCDTAGMYVNDRIREIIRNAYNRTFRAGDATPAITTLRFLDSDS